MMRMNCILLKRWVTCVAIGLMTFSAADELYGHGAGGDISIFSITTPAGEKVAVGFAILDDDDIEQIFFDPHDKVFNNILIPRTPTILPPIPWTFGSAEPGFDANEGELAPLKPIYFNLENLLYWDGSGAVNFGPPPAGLTGGFAPQPSLTFADGGHHSHPVFGIVGGGTPDGVYLATLTVSIDTMIDSDPFYLVSLVDRSLYTGDDETNADNAEVLGELVRAYLEDPMSNPEPEFGGRNYTFYAEAIRYAETLPIPEPSGCGLVMMASVALLAVRGRVTSR